MQKLFRPSSWSSLNTVKDLLSALSSFATVLAIIAGGWWFYEQNQDAPRMKIEHFVSTHEDGTSVGRLLLAVEIKATNTGNVPVIAPQGDIRLIRISPHVSILHDAKLNEKYLAPGEADQLFFHIFRIKDQPGTIQVETHVPGDDGTECETNSLFNIKHDAQGYAVTESGRKTP